LESAVPQSQRKGNSNVMMKTTWIRRVESPSFSEFKVESCLEICSGEHGDNSSSVLCVSSLRMISSSQARGTHACNISYSGVRDQKYAVQSQPRQIVGETLSWKTHHKKGPVDLLKVYVLSSNPSTAKINK
jgi:hypothetical protein